MKINLTKDELIEITGRVKATAQIKWLRQNGFTVLQRADGLPLISRTHFELKMGGVPGRSKSSDWKPNLEAL